MSLRSRIAKVEARCPAQLTAEELFDLWARGVITDYEVGRYAERMSKEELDRAIAMLKAELERTECAGSAQG